MSRKIPVRATNGDYVASAEFERNHFRVWFLRELAAFLPNEDEERTVLDILGEKQREYDNVKIQFTNELTEEGFGEFASQAWHMAMNRTLDTKMKGEPQCWPAVCELRDSLTSLINSWNLAHLDLVWVQECIRDSLFMETITGERGYLYSNIALLYGSLGWYEGDLMSKQGFYENLVTKEDGEVSYLIGIPDWFCNPSLSKNEQTRKAAELNAENNTQAQLHVSVDVWNPFQEKETEWRRRTLSEISAQLDKHTNAQKELVFVASKNATTNISEKRNVEHMSWFLRKLVRGESTRKIATTQGIRRRAVTYGLETIADLVGVSRSIVVDV